MRKGSGKSAHLDILILDRPMCAGFRHRGKTDLEVVSDKPVKDRFNERWTALTSLYGVDPTDPPVDPAVWKKLVAALIVALH
jgi:hypothetical protein